MCKGFHKKETSLFTDKNQIIKKLTLELHQNINLDGQRPVE